MLTRLPQDSSTGSPALPRYRGRILERGAAFFGGTQHVYSTMQNDLAAALILFIGMCAGIGLLVSLLGGVELIPGKFSHLPSREA